MRKILYLLIVVFIPFVFMSCLQNDLQDIQNQVDELEKRTQQLEENQEAYIELLQAYENKLHINDVIYTQNGTTLIMSDNSQIFIPSTDAFTPYIGVNDNWWINGEDTGVAVTGEDGSTPEIGSDGYWYINDENTGIKATGDQGDSPYIGANGNWWIEDHDTNVKASGQDGMSPEIGINGNWWIGDVDTQVPATGQDGATPEIGENGNWWINGEDTNISATGQDGVTPEIGENGNWWINGEDTSIKATAPYIISIDYVDDLMFFYFSDGTSLSIEVNDSGLYVKDGLYKIDYLYFDFYAPSTFYEEVLIENGLPKFRSTHYNYANYDGSELKMNETEESYILYGDLISYYNEYINPYLGNYPTYLGDTAKAVQRELRITKSNEIVGYTYYPDINNFTIEIPETPKEVYHTARTGYYTSMDGKEEVYFSPNVIEIRQIYQMYNDSNERIYIDTVKNASFNKDGSLSFSKGNLYLNRYSGNMLLSFYNYDSVYFDLNKNEFTIKPYELIDEIKNAQNLEYWEPIKITGDPLVAVVMGNDGSTSTPQYGTAYYNEIPVFIQTWNYMSGFTGYLEVKIYDCNGSYLGKESVSNMNYNKMLTENYIAIPYCMD